MAVSVCPEFVSCPICLDFLKDPVTTSCGHSYCMSCINTHWDQETDHSCPQCRRPFSSRPVLQKNTVLAGLVEQLQRTGLTAPPTDRCRPGEVSCDSCVEAKVRAVHSCLQCLAAFCERHIQPHYHSSAFKTHHLVAPSHHLQDYICSTHNKLKDMFCASDQQLICYLCSVDQHKDHETVSAAAGRAQRQGALESMKNQLLKNIQEQESDLHSLEEEARDLTRSAHEAVQRGRDSVTQLALLLEERWVEVEQEISSELEMRETDVRERQDTVQKNISDMKTTLSHINTLSITEDHCLFLQSYQALTGTPAIARIHSSARPGFKHMTTAVKNMEDQLQLALTEGLTNLSSALRQAQESPTEPGPCSRNEFLQYSRDLSVDFNSVSKRLSVSEGNRRVTAVRTDQGYPNHPDRFSPSRQVLSREALTGRCYWEVQVQWETATNIAVAYKSMERKGAKGTGFGHNDKSWSLYCYQNICAFWFNNVSSEVLGPASEEPVSRIGVYLDHDAGALRFYKVEGQTLTLLYRVQTRFTQPLYAGLWVAARGTAAFCHLSVCRAVYSYKPLGFNKGDIIEVLKEDSNGWWTGQLGHSEGSFPVSFVEKI